jgi:serine/threonine-protein kinase
MAQSVSQFQIGRYRIIAEIGRGGMAGVYKAYDADLERPVAIKVLPEALANDPEFVQRFQHEARMAARLHHPNIVTIYDVGHQGGLFYIVMQYLPGANLDQVIAHSGALPLDAAAAITSHVADALDHAHRQGMIHRDIKPSNIMVAADGQVTLTDFGLVRAGESSGLTHVGMIVGTPVYMSPEQAQGIAIDYRTDIYSLGIVCGKLLTGLAPFERSTPYATLLAQIHEPLPTIGAWARLPRNVRDTLQRATAKSPSERYQSAGAFAAELSAAVGVKRGKVVPVALPATQFVPFGREALALASASANALPTRLLGDAGNAPPDPGSNLPAAASASRPSPAPALLAAPRRKAMPVLVVAAAALVLLILGAGALWAAGPRWRGATAVPPPTLPRPIAAYTAAPEATAAPVLPTSTPAATATRTAPATGTPAPAVTLTPQIVTQVVVVTATPEPTPTATLSSTLPPATRPELPAPTAANTAAPAQPPAPQPGALTLIGPTDGARFSNGWNDKIQLSWRGDFALGPNDFFVVQVRYRHGSDIWTDDQWTKENALIVPSYVLDNATTDRFEWKVIVVREDPDGTLVFSGSKRRGYPLSDASPLRVFIWTAPGGGGGGGRATATPID